MALFIQINLQKDTTGKNGKTAKKVKKEKPKGKVSYYVMQYSHGSYEIRGSCTVKTRIQEHVD